MKLYTIGFTQKPAQRFFDLLQQHGVQCLVDTRLHPGGQLSGFAKQEDLRYFLSRLIDCDYRHLPVVAPAGFRAETPRARFDAVPGRSGVNTAKRPPEDQVWD